jgi:hypothetical protein
MKRGLTLAIGLAILLFPLSARADEMTKQLCTAAASNMQDYANERDAKVPEASVRAQLNGTLDNKIVSLIYSERDFTPAQFQAAVYKVCMETNDFSADDGQIILAIRVALQRH